MNFEKPMEISKNNSFKKELEQGQKRHKKILEETLKSIKRSVDILRVHEKYSKDIEKFQQTIDWLEKRIKELENGD